MKKYFLKRSLASVLIVTLVFVMSQISYIVKANAAALALGLSSDVVSTLTAGALASHDIKFTTTAGTGIAASSTVIYTFTEALATPVAASGSFTTADIAVKIDGTLQTGAASAALGSSADPTHWVFNISGSASSAFTVIAPSGGGVSTSGTHVFEVLVGTSAGGTNRIQNDTTPGSTTLTIGGTFGDTTTIQIPIITTSSVNVTATVSPTISFKIETAWNSGTPATAVCFGTLSSSAPKFATLPGGGSCAGGDGTGTTPDTRSTATGSAAHVLEIATNSSGGYDITVQGPTLTNSAYTIDALTATPASIATGGTEQFGIQVHLDNVHSGTAGNAAVFAFDGNGSAGGGGGSTYPSSFYAYGATSSAVKIAGSSGATAQAQYNVNYGANISAITEAGTYSTSLTYVATGKY